MKYRIRKTLENYKITTYVHADEVFPDNLIDCSLGINPFGFTSEITPEIFKKAFDTISRYPDFPYPNLRKAIAGYLSDVVEIAPEQIALNTGSIGVIWNLDRVIIDESTNVIAVAPTFSSTLSDMRSFGANIDLVLLKEEDDFKLNIDDLINSLKPSHHVIYIDNPNNPTGQIIPIDDLRKLAGYALKQNTYLIVDEAYGDFMDLSNSAVTLINEFPNVITIKTLSKGFGLAGLRTGYMVMNKNFIPYMSLYPGEMTVTGVASYIIPLALKDRKHIEDSRKKIAANKKKLLDSLTVLKSSKTDLTVPIVLLYTDKDINLYNLFIKYGIKSERGEDFDAIGKRHIRIRVPADPDECIKRIKILQNELI